jgi:hypothetical protein
MLYSQCYLAFLRDGRITLKRMQNTQWVIAFVGGNVFRSLRKNSKSIMYHIFQLNIVKNISTICTKLGMLEPKPVSRFMDLFVIS